jgi:hypothetical protein
MVAQCELRIDVTLSPCKPCPAPAGHLFGWNGSPAGSPRRRAPARPANLGANRERKAPKTERLSPDP